MTAEEFLKEAKIILGEDEHGNDYMLDINEYAFSQIVKAMEQYASTKAEEVAIEFGRELLKEKYYTNPGTMAGYVEDRWEQYNNQ